MRAAAASAPLLHTIRALADYCAEPGRTLTAKGNLRLADARHLVGALSTGDDPTFGGMRKLTSADELPTLSWYVHLAVESGAVRRHKGKLVAVTRFAVLDDVAAYDRIFRAALESGIGIRRVPLLNTFEPAGDLLDGCVIVHLMELLHGDAETDELIETARRTVRPARGRAAMFIDELLASTVREQLEQLVSLGAVQIVGREASYCEDSPQFVDAVHSLHRAMTAASHTITAMPPEEQGLLGRRMESAWHRHPMSHPIGGTEGHGGPKMPTVPSA